MLTVEWGTMNKITQIHQSLAPKAFAAIAERIAASKNGEAVFKGGAYCGTVGGEIWHIGFGSQTFVNTWTDASFGL